VCDGWGTPPRLGEALHLTTTRARQPCVSPMAQHSTVSQTPEQGWQHSKAANQRTWAQ